MVIKKQIEEDNAETYQVIGTLTGSSAEDRLEAFMKSMLAGDGKDMIILDMEHVDAINSACIGKLLLMKTRLQKQNKDMKIQSCNSRLLQTFKIIGAASLLNIDCTQDNES
ncbi:MAG: STAS domain-containing protein [Spirochaetia bacterium]